MAYSTAINTTKANVEALITALTGSETIDELLIIDKAASGLNCSNYSVLEAAIETLINTQISSTAHEDILLASVLLNQTQARTHTTYTTINVTTSGSISVPANASRCFVSCTAGRYYFNNYTYPSSYVVEFEIGVQAGGSLEVTRSSGRSGSHVIGGLVVRSGTNVIDSGVYLAGVLQPIDNVTVFENPSRQGNYSAIASSIDLKFEIVTVV